MKQDWWEWPMVYFSLIEALSLVTNWYGDVLPVSNRPTAQFSIVSGRIKNVYH